MYTPCTLKWFKFSKCFEFLHPVDSNKVLICEVYAFARNAADCLLSPDLSTPKASEFDNNILLNDHNNV